MKKLILAALVLLSVESFAQTHAVQGSVFVFDSLKVANVEVEALKAKTKIRTDSLGNFSIVCNDKDVLLFKSKVFGTKRVKVNKADSKVEVNLNSLRTKAEIDMAIGYGYISEKDRTTAMKHLELQNKYTRFNNMNDALKATDASLMISDNCVVIRGVNTISQSANNCALIIVDGVRVETFNDINPQLVENITILKDASSSAIYGAESANGVILITTKK